MNREDLFKSINELDDRILEQSESPVNAPEKPLRRRFGLAAACLVIVIVALYAAGRSGLFNTHIQLGGSGSGGSNSGVSNTECIMPARFFHFRQWKWIRISQPRE